MPSWADLLGAYESFSTLLVDQLAYEGTALAHGNGYTTAREVNAIVHTHVSAFSSYIFGEDIAKVLGDAKEWKSDGAADTLKDQYNNEIGRQIGEWARENGYGPEAIDQAVIDAMNNGQLIVDLTDARLGSTPEWYPEINYSTALPKDYSNVDDPLAFAKDILEEALAGLYNALGIALPGLGLLDNLADLLAEILRDPLVLDLDGDGIELVPLDQSATLFDLDGDGVAERTGWVSPHDGLLVHDANGNETVDGVAELFGSANVDGYDELSTLDANGDGRIDTSDPAFAQLRVWRDLNSDGLSILDEMQTLTEAGIARLNLGYSQVDQDMSGNVLMRSGTYVRADGTTRSMGSVNFALDEPTPVIPAGADLSHLSTLPNLAGQLGLPDLRTAMFFDSTLQAMVENLVYGAHDFDTFAEFTDGGFLDILYRWAGMDASVPLGAEDQPYWLQALSAFLGRPFDELNTHQFQRLEEEVWPAVVQQLGAQFLVQAAALPSIRPFMEVQDDLATLNPDDPGFGDALGSLIQDAIAGSGSAGPAYDYLDVFAALSVDFSTGEIVGDFDAFVAQVLEQQPSFQVSWVWAPGGSGGAPAISISGEGGENRHPWTAWYEDQGSLLFTAGQLMGISADYVLNVTGWRWLSGGFSRHEGSSGSDLLDFTVTQYEIGNIWTGIHLVDTRDQLLFGYEGDDELRGNDGVDRLVGGVGSDLLRGGSGSDMYVYASGDELDRIIDDSGTDDTIYFSSELNSADLHVTRLAGTNDLLLHFGDPAAGIVLQNQWTAPGSAIEHAHFVAEDGLDSGDIASLYLATLATSGADAITGSWASERLIGLDGDDALNGADGNDILDGGGGNDTLRGGNHVDTLTGGPGNDRLEGSSGADTYVYGLGDGDDVIDDYNGTSTRDGSVTDTLVFGEGINADDLVLSRVSTDFDDIRISFVEHAGSILIDNQHWSTAGIESVIFADGTSWTLAQLMARYVADQQTAGNDTIWGTYGADVMNGGAGVDTMVGSTGSDRYYVDNALDAIAESSGQGTEDWAFSSVDYALAAGVHVEVLGTTSENGTDPFDLTGNEFNQMLHGNAGANILDGRGGNDRLFGRGGDDSLTGGAGADLFVFNGAAPGNDRILDFVSGTDRIDLSAFGITQAQVSAAASGADTILSIDRDSDGVADFTIMLVGAGTPAAADYIL